MRDNSLLVDANVLVFSPTLASKIGLNETIILHQIHYWLSNPKIGKIHNDRKWMRNTYEEWQINFPFWSISTIRRGLTNLEIMGLIETANLNIFRYDQTKWYTINYDKIRAIP